MKVRLFVTLALCFVLSGLARAQEMPKPGPEHEKLKELVGDWDCTFKMGTMESPAKASYKLDLGGFYLAESFEGNFGGMKFQGKAQSGYCPIKKQYFTFWTDSMSPTPMFMAGNFDKEGKTLTLTGEGPNEKGAMTKFKSVSTMTDKDTVNFTMFMVEDGKDNPAFTITYKRKK